MHTVRIHNSQPSQPPLVQLHPPTVPCTTVGFSSDAARSSPVRDAANTPSTEGFCNWRGTNWRRRVSEMRSGESHWRLDWERFFDRKPSCPSISPLDTSHPSFIAFRTFFLFPLSLSSPSLHVLPPLFPPARQPFPTLHSMTPQSPSPAETLDLILGHLLPLLLAAATSVKALVSRWRLLHSKLLLLQSSLTEASLARNSLSNPLFIDLLSSLHSTLQTLHSLSSRCLDPSLPTGRLLLQSDLDIATSSLTLHLQDLTLLLKSGLLSHQQDSPHAIVLPLPGPTSSKADIVLFIRDAFARLQIGNLEIKLKALDSLLDLLQSDPAKLSPVVTSEGDVPVLLRLLDPSTHSHLIDRASAVVSLLSTSSASSCHAVFNEGGLGPLLRLIESGSVTARHRAAAAVEAITIDPSRAWAVSAYGGITVLINACRSGSGSPSSLQSLIASSLKNVASLEDVRISIFEEGGIPVLVQLLTSDSIDAQKSSALCLWSLASAGGDEMCVAIIHESGLSRLLQLLYSSSDRELLENALRAIHALSVVPSAAKSLSASPLFFSRLAEFISRGGISNFSCQQIAASLVADLSPSDDIKKSMAPCMSPLVKMLEVSKPVVMQETASRALVSLLDVKSNRRNLLGMRRV